MWGVVEGGGQNKMPLCPQRWTKSVSILCLVLSAVSFLCGQQSVWRDFVFSLKCLGHKRGVSRRLGGFHLCWGPPLTHKQQLSTQRFSVATLINTHFQTRSFLKLCQFENRSSKRPRMCVYHLFQCPCFVHVVSWGPNLSTGGFTQHKHWTSMLRSFTLYDEEYHTYEDETSKIFPNEKIQKKDVNLFFLQGHIITIVTIYFLSQQKFTFIIKLRFFCMKITIYVL